MPNLPFEEPTSVVSANIHRTMHVTNRMLNKRKEKDCFGITAERKYYECNNTFVKRSLRPREWQTSHVKGTVYVPRLGAERIFNEAASLQFIRKMTDIPVPKVHCCFEDDEAVYLVTEEIKGVAMHTLTESQKEVVIKELEQHIQTLCALRSPKVGGPSGLVVPPYRAMLETFRDDWTLRESDHDEFVFCHNDLSQHNVLVDPDSLKIAGIIDWEYAGFWPDFFEGRFFMRKGPSAAIDEEVDDTEKLIEFLESRQVHEE